jgi:uncharacterized protein YkwD
MAVEWRRALRIRHALLTAVLLLAACAGPDGDRPGAPTAAEPTAGATVACEDDREAFRRAIVAAVNAARRSAPACGGSAMEPVAALAWSPALGAAARDHARDMAGNDFLAHAGSDGRRVDRRASDAGYEWRAIGENVGAGARSVAQAVDHWLGSPSHCRNLLNGDYSEFGAACASAPDSRYGTYWALILGEPQPE